MRLGGCRLTAPTQASPCQRGIVKPTLPAQCRQAGPTPRSPGRVLSPLPDPHIPARAAGTALHAGHRSSGHASETTTVITSPGDMSGQSGSSPGPPQGPGETFLPSEQQQRAIDAVMAGRNVFLTGCAGTGKSATLNALRRHLESRYDTTAEYERRVAVVAMTGLAATLVGGVTLNSLLKLRTCEQFRDLERMTTDDKVLALLLELDTLIVDEASMMSAELLQALDHYLSRARRQAAAVFMDFDRRRAKEVLEGSDRPFGGLQMVLSGDLFQLGPIKKGSHTAAGGAQRATPRSPLTPAEQTFLNRGLLFEAPVFHGYGDFECVELEKVFRQVDGDFVALLNAIRCGTDSECAAAKSRLRELCARPLDDSDGIMPTLLFSKNDKVRGRNEEELRTLGEALVALEAVDAAYVTHEPPVSNYAALVGQKLLTQTEYDKLVSELDAEVMAGRTHESKLASLKPEAARVAEHLRRSWRRAVKSYVEEVARGDKGLFKSCQAAGKVQLKVGAQVMLVWNMDLDSRLANGSRGVVTEFHMADGAFRKECIALAEKQREADCGQEMKRWLDANPLIPRVRFTNGEHVLVRPAVYIAVVPGYGVSVRVQMPLKLAWAITVHKAQGMTLDKVVVDMSQFFGHGMLYTALSRARGPEGLQLVGDTAREMDAQVWRWWQVVRSGGTYQPDGQQQQRPRQGHPVWCWYDSQQPVAGQPQNTAAEAWFLGVPADPSSLQPPQVREQRPQQPQQPKRLLPEGRTGALKARAGALAEQDGGDHTAGGLNRDGSSGDGDGGAGGDAAAPQGAGTGQPRAASPIDAAAAAAVAAEMFSSLPELVDVAQDVESGLKRLLARKGAVTKADVSELLARHSQLVSALEEFEEWRRGRQAHGVRPGDRGPARGGEG